MAVRCYRMPDRDVNGLVWEILFDDGKIVATGPGSFKDTLANNLLGQWLNFRILQDFDSHSWAVLVNDNVAGTALPMFNNVDVCNGIEFAGLDPSDGFRFYVDDVAVSNNPDFQY
jgi:hypothetical protein